MLDIRQLRCDLGWGADPGSGGIFIGNEVASRAGNLLAFLGSWNHLTILRVQRNQRQRKLSQEQRAQSKTLALHAPSISLVMRRTFTVLRAARE